MRTWRPSTDPNASLVLEPAVTPGSGVLSVGAYGSYAFHPVAVRAPGSDVELRPVAHALAVDAVANLGIGERFAVGAALPVLVYQEGTGTLPTSGIGDLGISLKATLLPNAHGGLGLAALGYGTLPTGDRASFASDHTVTGTFRLLAEYTILIALLEASVGYTARTDNHTWPAGAVRFGGEIPWSIGLVSRPAAMGLDPGNRQRVELAFHGWLPAGPVGPFGSGDPGSAKLSPVLFAFDDRVEIGHYRDTFVTVGGEIGLNDAIGVPTFRAVLAFGWAPRSHDRDHDGVTDDFDSCPDEPGTKGGCPE